MIYSVYHINLVPNFNVICQSCNIYVYGANNPIMYVDPKGMFFGYTDKNGNVILILSTQDIQSIPDLSDVFMMFGEATGIWSAEFAGAIYGAISAVLSQIDNGNGIRIVFYNIGGGLVWPITFVYAN